MNDYQQLKLITELVTKSIESGKLNVQPTQLPQQPIVVEEPKSPTYEGGRITFFDILTCIMFTLNLLGLTDINWLLVFVPFALPYIVFYGMLWGMMLWIKFKNRKNKKVDEETKTN